MTDNPTILRYGNQIITCRPDGFFANIRKATRLDNADAMEDLDLFLHLAGADYGVTAHQIINPVTGEPIPRQFAVLRGTDNVVLNPSTVTESYGLITPTVLADSVRHLVNEGHCFPSDFMFLTKSDIAGNGEVLVLKMNTGLNAAGEDDLQWFLVLTNFHGRGKVKARIVCFRPSCENQMGSIMSEFDWAVSHRVPRGERGETAKRVISKAAQWENLNHRLETIGKRLDAIKSVDVPDPLVFVNPLLGIKPDAKDEDISGQKRNMRDAIVSEFHNHSRGAFGRNGWDLLNGLTAVNTHGHETIASKVGPSRRSAGILSGSAGKREAELVKMLVAAA
jgi:hypothetical protein